MVVCYNINGDNMDGIFLIDKPEHQTSFDVIRQLRKKFNIKKMGHAGTLDPFATGLLIILVGKATKLSKYLIQDNKSYETTYTFGAHTDSYDITGNLLKESSFIPNIIDINDALNKLKTYQQEPPMYSAIKQKGQKLVNLARRGIEIERPKKEVHIHSYTIHSYVKPNISLTLSVSKGTYIRSIAVDLAAHLNTYAYVSKLRRIASGMYDISDAKLIDDIHQNDLIPLDTLLKDYPKITVSPYIAEKVNHGLVMDERQYQGHGPFTVYNEQGELIGFYEVYKNNTFKPVLIVNDETI